MWGDNFGETSRSCGTTTDVYELRSVTSGRQTDTNVRRLHRYGITLSRSGPVRIVQRHQLFQEEGIDIVKVEVK